MRVLIVDDDEAIRNAMQKALKALGIENTEEASDGSEAVTMATDTEQAFDVAICDLNMPGEDGLIMAKRLGALRYAPAIIFSSGLDDGMISLARDLAEGHGRKVLGVARQPLSLDSLKELLESA